MKLCIDCRHCVREIWCQTQVNGINPVDGEPQVRFAIMQRKDETLCGTDAKFFEPKSEPVPLVQAWWKRIFK